MGNGKEDAIGVMMKALEMMERKDSLEWGSATKGGARKIYTDFNDWEKTVLRIDAANRAAIYANETATSPPPAPEKSEEKPQEPGS